MGLALPYTSCIVAGVMAVGQAIKAARERLGLSQEALGDRLQVSGLTVSRWERGERLPRRGQWPKIREIMGVQIGLVGVPEEVAE
jgi:transcriptional regulator with XRE-family HTH domain